MWAFTMNAKLSKLPIDEHIRLVEELWDSIASDQKALQFTDEQKAELDRRLDAYAADGSQGRLATESITDIRQQAATLEVRLRPKAEQDSSDAAAYRIIIVPISRSGFLFLVHHLERPILKWVKWKYKRRAVILREFSAGLSGLNPGIRNGSYTGHYSVLTD